MRVITGTARGRRLKELEGYETRPTTDRVKEGIFNIIQFDLEGRKILDLFAGTGQLGIEALSRGAASAVFIDQRRDAAALIKENLKLTRLEENTKIICGDAAAYLSSTREKFDIIFIDPPYAANLWKNTISLISEFDILSNHGIIVCESPDRQDMPQVEPPYFFRKDYRYGKTKITTYFREEDPRMKIAVCPGSFDPITVGHLDLAQRAAAIFDKVILCVMVNSEKTHMFSLDERLALARAAVAHLPNVEAMSCSGLLAAFAQNQGACALVKGVRGSGDLDWETQMAQINRDLCPTLDTVFLPARPEHLHISSTLAREMLRHNQPLERYIPAGAMRVLDEFRQGKV